VTEQQAKQFHPSVPAGSDDGSFDTIHVMEMPWISVLANPHLACLLRHPFT
jgi:hypothetical protein